ncbi:D-alanyl-D-alanine carboxypeptidase / D-alanyl-D-alanine-endopeptidase (penicillin-binding protein 4) [Palleronia salina]|uniref:D-alanyl-D-alanine carboxypeptidase / D-alanyl-D-alanine-endopeptidase (Penicillin-binding protein 4) n=1 Tax=Palleronia salina TaxID=313368 RepID=A0A1M6JAI9_9RHOB|nr:D-alanyl-D-alanine carboxypeptidase/D-alanyl-D-alanine-endopeptidase [Palleronia salina]SHJ43715.1 D-alanyl-D-alanine carboxypeptidase / D-alanyl-D-alanine-endopeptidase (penicillin-binding protein 4) [Palleronia salina]
MRLTRRTILTGLLASAAGGALAEAPATSLRPRARAVDFFKRALPTGDDLVARAGLGAGKVAYVVADATTGEVLESRAPLLPQPPASTAKALTALYHLDRLGPDHRFSTRLLATGPVVNGRIDGDLILAGGGDPTLDTDGLARLASQLKDAGVREVAGNLRIWTGALPNLHEIDVEQPDHVGYNPAVGGLNLNFNRVHFGWERKGGDYQVSMDARSATRIPGVAMARMQVVDRSGPVYTYARGEARDDWTVARGALGSNGSRWLPVRFPGLYAGEVFQTLARSNGLMIGGPVLRADAPEGDELAQVDSAESRVILEDMLEYSTNLTAEIMGLSASKSDGDVETLAGSAARMNEWLKSEMGLRSVALEDHSGLGDDSRITASDMCRAMVASGPDGALRPLMKPFRTDDTTIQVAAKTGTLNFVSALTGFIGSDDGRRPLAFAVFCSDIDRRDALSMAERERPAGGRAWAGRARTLQRALIAHWNTWYRT